MARFLTTRDVAELLCAPEATVRYWRHIGYGPAGCKVGRRVLYAQADVDAWLDALKAAEVAALGNGG